jgi:hypothetical protein
MEIKLKEIPDDQVIGIYGEGKRHLPQRMRYLAPDAADSFLADLTPVAVVSDMLRSAESSLRARREGRGAQRPGYSGHGYGFSIDVDVDKMLRTLKFKTKAQLDAWMIERNWHCHRRDHRRGSEDWHHNYLTPDEYKQFVKPNDERTSAALERKISANYGAWWLNMSPSETQRCLAKLKLYSGEIDGKFGPLSREATRVFQRAWMLEPTGKPDTMTNRTLAFVTADKVIVP